MHQEADKAPERQRQRLPVLVNGETVWLEDAPDLDQPVQVSLSPRPADEKSCCSLVFRIERRGRGEGEDRGKKESKRELKVAAGNWTSRRALKIECAPGRKEFATITIVADKKEKERSRGTFCAKGSASATVCPRGVMDWRPDPSRHCIGTCTAFTFRDVNLCLLPYKGPLLSKERYQWIRIFSSSFPSPHASFDLLLSANGVSEWKSPDVGTLEFRVAGDSCHVLLSLPAKPSTSRPPVLALINCTGSSLAQVQLTVLPLGLSASILRGALLFQGGVPPP